MKKYYLLILCCLFFIILLLFGIKIYMSIPKLAYVRTAVLIEKFDGMKYANEEFQKTIEKYQSQFETLQVELNNKKEVLGQNIGKMSSSERERQDKLIAIEEEKLNRFAQAINEKSKKENEKLMEGVLNQVNTFIAKYAKSKRYTFVFGTSLDGNILYGDEVKDITDEILIELNKEF